MTPRTFARVAFSVVVVFLVGCLDAADRAGLDPADLAAGFVSGLDAEALAGSAAEEPEPEPLSLTARERAPRQIRGLYLTAYTAGSATRRPELLELARRTEINTFVIDVKTEQGVHFQSETPLAAEFMRPGHVPIRNLAGLVAEMRENGLYTIARIVVFKDPLLAKARPEWSIRRPDGGVWIDRAGHTWVSPWDRRVWDYNLALAEEAARAGFDEIQFDYIRFPEAYASLPRQVHPQAAGDRTDAIVAFLEQAHRVLEPHDVTITADVFGMSMNEAGDVGIGQQWERIAVVTDHILPMIYPSHYFPTHLPGVSRPNRMPYETIATALGMGVIRNERLAAAGGTPARIIPWLQAFDAPWVDRDFPYRAEQVRAQIQAVYDVGLEDWILWDPGVRYERVADAFEAETLPRARTYSAPDGLLRRVDTFEEWGMRKHREMALGRGMD
jgi:hypothetical protein